MNNRGLINSFWLAACVVVLSACAGPGHFELVQPASSIKGVLYIYRPKANNPGLQPLRFSYPDIVIDGENIGQLKFNSHLFTQLNAGAHHIKITGLTKTANWEVRDIEQDVDINPGEIKYLKLDVQFNLSEMNIGQPNAQHLIHLTPITPTDAIYEIRETHLSK